MRPTFTFIPLGLQEPTDSHLLVLDEDLASHECASEESSNFSQRRRDPAKSRTPPPLTQAAYWESDNATAGGEALVSAGERGARGFDDV